VIFVGYLRKPFVPALVDTFVNGDFTQTQKITLTNTTTETSMVGSGTGSVLYPSEFFVIGKSIDLKAAGFISAKNGHTSTLRIYLGNIKLVESTLTMPAALTDASYDLYFTLSCVGENLIIGQGYTRIMAGVGQTTSYFRPLRMTADATINASTSNLLNITYQWGTADTGDSVTSTNAIVTSIM
jgi:hypothetical protein